MDDLARRLPSITGDTELIVFSKGHITALA